MLFYKCESFIINDCQSFRIALHGIDTHISLGEIVDDTPVIPLGQKFLTLFPRKSILELHSTMKVVIIFYIMFEFLQLYL